MTDQEKEMKRKQDFMGGYRYGLGSMYDGRSPPNQVEYPAEKKVITVNIWFVIAIIFALMLFFK